MRTGAADEEHRRGPPWWGRRGARGDNAGSTRLGPFRHLSFRLFFLLFGSMALLLATFTALVVREHRRHLMENVSLSAGRAGDVIRRATRSSMMRNQRTELHEIIQNIGTQAGIDLVRIYNKEGRIMFSTLAGEIGERVDLGADACHRCHAQVEPQSVLQGSEAARIFSNGAHRVLGWISPIPNESDCSTAPCHAHDSEQTVLGVLDVWMSLEQVDGQLQESSANMGRMAGVVALGVALSFGWLIYRLVQRPVERLIAGTRAVSLGDLEHVIPTGSADDLGVLAHSFNSMTQELQRAREEKRRWAETLEDKVAEKTRELRRAMAHLMQMDRMASLGKLSATVAHEINNPLAGILTYARLVERELADGNVEPATLESMRRSLQMISSETRRCGEIARNLLVFARSAALRTESVHLLELVTRSLGLVQHHLELRGVVVRQAIVGDDDLLRCSPGEIQQAILALLVNAVEAMPNGGTLRVTVRLEAQTVGVAIEDTGVGIPAENLPRLFEPFFTTKSEAKGVGLGLAVVYGIMQRHGGRVDVQSRVDVGSTFTLLWPRYAPETPMEAGQVAGAAPALDLEAKQT